MAHKRFVYSELEGSGEYQTLAAGTLVVDSNNQLRFHNGTTEGGTIIPTTFASVASSGSYTDLINTPTSLINFISSYSSSNDKQFLRYNNSTGAIEFSTGFRVVDVADIAYPDGTLGVDQQGDVAFAADGIYVCVSNPNSFDISINSSAGYVNQGWITVSNTPEAIQVGYKFTDGTTTADVVEIVSAFNGTYGVYRISPEVPGWYGGVPSTLSVITSGSTVNTGNWQKFNNDYTPGNSAHWASPAPTTFGEALDKIAAALYALNTNTPI